MEYLHSQQVVHFDLKCENLLCDLRDLERPVVKIGDLGLSKQKKERYITGNMRGETCCSRAGRDDRWAGGGAAVQLTYCFPWSPSTTPAGTIPFMAPELWSDDQVTEKVDVYRQVWRSVSSV